VDFIQYRLTFSEIHIRYCCSIFHLIIEEVPYIQLMTVEFLFFLNYLSHIIDTKGILHVLKMHRMCSLILNTNDEMLRINHHGYNLKAKPRIPHNLHVKCRCNCQVNFVINMVVIVSSNSVHYFWMFEITYYLENTHSILKHSFFF